jgi:uncharacterized protein (TIGR02145 family)
MIESDPVYLTVVNPAVTSGVPAVIYQGVSANLTLTLTNNSGGPITMGAGDSAAVFQVFFPRYFTKTELEKIQIAPPAHWSWAPDPNGKSFSITYAGEKEYEWPDGGKLVIQCASVETAAQPGTNRFQINTKNMTGNVPPEIFGDLSVLPPPQPGNADLTQVLQVALQSQGSIYVSSSASDQLQNTLFLTLTNIGATALYTGTEPWKTAPTVTITFTYGTSAGALASGAKDNDGSAWSIEPGIAASQGNKWAASPTKADDANNPYWELTPQNLEPAILGTGESASITFSFSKIVSITPVGHTRMKLRFSGFPASKSQAYNDCVYVLDIVKQAPPPTRGLLNFYGTAPVVCVTGADQPVSVDLKWSMLYVDHVRLVCSFPGVAPLTRNYPDEAGLGYDSATVVIRGVATSTPIFFTVQGYSASGEFLNALQYAVWVNSQVFMDPRGGKIYPTVLINGLYWMTENLDWGATNSLPYGNLISNEATYGRLYPFEQAQQQISLPPPPPAPPFPWRLPTIQDWNNLLTAAGQTSSQKYQALVLGGVMGFNALLGGQGDDQGKFTKLGHIGCYWVAAPDGSQAYICKFSADSTSVNVATKLPTNYLASVRYVRNA